MGQERAVETVLRHAPGEEIRQPTPTSATDLEASALRPRRRPGLGKEPSRPAQTSLDEEPFSRIGRHLPFASQILGQNALALPLPFGHLSLRVGRALPADPTPETNPRRKPLP